MKMRYVFAVFFIVISAIAGIGCEIVDTPAKGSFINQTADYTPEAVRFGGITVTNFAPGTATQEYEIESGDQTVEIRTGGVWLAVSETKYVSNGNRYVVSVTKTGSSYKWTILESME